VVVDGVATGHITGQLAAPQAIQELVQVGMVRDQTGWMLDILGDPAQTGVVIVSAPEEMPVNETIELAERLRTETVVDLAAVVANRVLPELFGRAEEEVFDALAQLPADALADAVGGPVHQLLDGAQLAVTLRRTRGVHLARLRSELPEGTPLLYVPYLFQRSHGARATSQVAAHLGEELGF
jgi:anion-transporting  ArsA/GET3 family ATPase